MKTISISILLCSTCWFSFGQQLSVLRSPKEIKPEIGDFVTTANSNNLKEHAYKLSKYETLDGGQGTFLKYESQNENTESKAKQSVAVLRVVPNPNNGYFNVSISNAGTALGQLFIYDILGVVIINTPFNNAKGAEINLTEHPSGIYFIKCIWGDQVMNQRIVKQ